MPASQPSTIEMLMPFAFIFAIFYFLIIRPQGKRMKDQEKFITALKRGDAVVTTGGVLGTIDGLTDAVVTLEIASDVKIKVLKKQIVGSQAALLALKEVKKG